MLSFFCGQFFWLTFTAVAGFEPTTFIYNGLIFSQAGNELGKSKARGIRDNHKETRSQLVSSPTKNTSSLQFDYISVPLVNDYNFTVVGVYTYDAKQNLLRTIH